jgi:TetR/AcrR family transcriptional regulator
MASRNASAAAKRVKSGASNESGRPHQRAEQQRSRATRNVILSAAFAEFAEKGFEAASIRSIADRAGVQHPLITYHYPSKDVLWQAVAESTFARIRDDWDAHALRNTNPDPLERLRAEYQALFRHTVAFPDFHRFMRQETSSNNPRLHWVADTVLKPLLDRLLPQIAAAQEQGQLPRVEPIIFHYMMVSLTITLSEFGPEMQVTSDISADRADVVGEYWDLVDTMVFRAANRSRDDR